MEHIFSEISGMCRLCLCEGDEILLPACKILDLPSAVEDVERCTGVRIMEARDIPYSICEDCNCKLKDFATFRKVCLTNDEIFRKLFPMVFEDDAEPEHQDGSFTQPGRYELDEKQQEISDHSGYVASYESPSLESFVQKIEYLENDDDLSDCTDGEHSSKLEGELEIDEKLEDGNRRLSACVKDDSDQENEQQLPFKCEVHPQDALPYSIQRADHDNTSNSAQHDGNIQSGNKASRKRLCPICGKLVYDISDHKLSHTNEKKYACPHCSMAYSRKAYLKIHIQSVHQKKVVKTCDICNQDFAYKTGYDAHMRARHNIGKWYECKPCNMKFRHPGGLRNHNNRKHNEGSNCECPVCGLKFLDKMGLRNHSRVHSSEKMFACKYCPKRFRSPNAHRGHELTHLGVTFRCPHCPKSYRYKQNLKIHLAKHDEKENV